MSDTLSTVPPVPVSVKTRLKKLLPSKKALAIYSAGAATTAALVAVYAKSHQEVQDAFADGLANDVTEHTDYIIDVTTPTNEK